MDWAALFACITALGTGWFAYNQLKHNRLADIKAKELERQLERKSTRRSENSARVYGEIHKVLNDLSCDRVYIIQPYPLGENHYLTILYEVTAKGVARISDYWQDIKMSELPKFTAAMAKNEYMLIRDIDSLDGTRAKAMFPQMALSLWLYKSYMILRMIGLVLWSVILQSQSLMISMKKQSGKNFILQPCTFSISFQK